MIARYRIIVDTESYAGNFERPAVAYATGQIGDCTVGEEEAQLAREELSTEEWAFWAEHLIQMPNDQGVRRPVKIVPTPGWFNPGMGDFFLDTEEGRAAALIAYRQALRHDHENNRIQWATPEGHDQARQARLARIEEAERMTEVPRYPACLSLAVELDVAPSATQVQSLEARIRQYLSIPLWWRPAVTVTGSRVLRVTETAEEVSLD